jgi:FkbM family methyltransferase
MPLDPDNHFPYELADSGEEGLIRAWLTMRKDADPFVFFDVGANRGDYTGFLLTEATQRVDAHLFEISPVMWNRLYEKYGWHGNVNLNAYGLGDESGEFVYRRFPGHEGVNTILPTDYWDLTYEPTFETCFTMTGDEYCRARTIDLIHLLKIDTEGWDWKILHGFEGMLTANKIEVVQFEYGYTTADLHVVLKDFWDYLSGMGYKLGRLNREGVNWTAFQYTDNDFFRCSNWVAFSPTAIKELM